MPADTHDAVLSFYRVRQAMGAIGIVVPVLLVGLSLAGYAPLPPALSDYYHTPLRDLFVGTMVSLGVFLLTYLGHREINGIVTDRTVSTAAGLGAIGIALAPNRTLDPCLPVPILMQTDLMAAIHVLSAGVFLGATAVFCLVLFPRAGRTVPTPGKRRRNQVYRLCGWAILLSLAGLGAYFLALGPEARCAIRDLRPVLWLEVVTVLAFGVAWLVKGRGIRALNDDRHDPRDMPPPRDG
ncbi:hypothetical protein BCF33_2447 [Hasllibacter halocynthiae]|uniref:DUF998 domain-containing protein n=1 Tax=Hasllibacter halocynthiae TaxID=595589 RepID=A0A2T0X3P6_9RHOB|nr:DUF998 domain-containing protein [Hasllibacter halocynthiae]PRY93573.1 hypothetical protein BCF33_2447 [Hasllibacter halocynthiae]